LRPKNLQKCMELNWNFLRGGEVLRKISSVGKVWIFSGATHYANELFVRVRLSFLKLKLQTCFNNMQKQYKKMFGKHLMTRTH